ncbi:MAG: SDR family NAD(P)-dependent oxidoreductase [Anaerolineales bacterium]|nr:SDR family NAD(P)-dependent oxidoreductase [Anaerolineales bacterium]
MKTVVITGSTRGIGFGMADAFLARGCAVMINGRLEQGVERAVEALRRRYPDHAVYGFSGDVRDSNRVEALWRQAEISFEKIDIWINNAGISGPQMKTWEISQAQAKEIVETDLLGVIYGSQIAMKGMMKQGFGSIYNMEGAGSDGRMHDGLIIYGMTKYGVSYFTKGLISEAAGSPVIVGSIRPGMVITDFILEQFEGRPEAWERAKRIFNIIADRVETVAPWIVDRILANEKNGTRISRSSRSRLFFRFITAPFRRRDLFEDESVS